SPFQIGRHPLFMVWQRKSQRRYPDTVKNPAEIEIRTCSGIPVRQYDYSRIFITIQREKSRNGSIVFR
ncbi:hypothetical protein OFM36_38780, partial [Escherichia coli]|nr:hypothetical protein [Escherichia coli]